MRTTVQALAAVLGGTQSLHTNARDEALALPTDEAARLALRTQQILAHEAGVTETPDPLAGLVLRGDADRPAGGRGDRRYLDEIDAMGGAVAAIEAGYPAAPDPGGGLPRPARDRGRASAIVVGVNRFVDDDGVAPDRLQRIDPAAEARAGRRGVAAPARRARRRQPGGGARAAGARPRGSDEPACRRIIDAVEARATLGEISDRLRRAWGEHRELVTV